MDQAAIETAKLLGSGSVQLVLSIGAVFFAGLSVWLGMKLYAELKACAAQTLDLAIKKIDSDNKLADALGGLERVIEATTRPGK